MQGKYGTHIQPRQSTPRCSEAMVNAHIGRAIKSHLQRISQCCSSKISIWRHTRGQGDTTSSCGKVAIVIKGEKLTTDAGQEVWYALGQEETRRFYTGAIVMNRSTNTGGLGWLQYQFAQVSWKSIDPSLRTKPDMFQIWHAKQCIGICATQSPKARIQDILDSKCPTANKLGKQANTWIAARTMDKPSFFEKASTTWWTGCMNMTKRMPKWHIG
jgi:hypothetical protein